MTLHSPVDPAHSTGDDGASSLPCPGLTEYQIAELWDARQQMRADNLPLPYKPQWVRRARSNWITGYLSSKLRKDARSFESSTKSRIGNAGWQSLRDLFSSFLDLPLDVIYEVYSHLHPLDLYHLTKVDSITYLHLSSPGSRAVWEHAFKHPLMAVGPHRYPILGSTGFGQQGMTFPELASFLFGPAFCDTCLRPGAMPDFSLLKRACSNCLGKQWITRRSFKDDPDLLVLTDSPGFRLLTRDNFWNMITPMMSRGSMTYTDNLRNSLAYKADDLRHKVQEMKTWTTNICGDSSQRQAFEHRKAVLIADVSKNWRVTYHNTIWACTIQSELRVQFSGHEESFRKRVRKYLEKEGISPVEVTRIVQRIYLNSCLGRRKRMCNREARTMAHLGLRLDKQAKEEIVANSQYHSRRSSLLYSYQFYKQSTAPGKWLTLPNETALLYDPVIEAQLRKPLQQQTPGITLSGVSRPDITSFLARFERDTTKRAEEELMKWSPPSSLAPINHSHIELATSVFACPQHIATHLGCRTIIGTQDLLRHSCTVRAGGFHRDLTCLSFSVIGRRVSSMILEALGLDPSLTLASQMDTRQDRFVCLQCPPVRKRLSETRPAWTWREIVSHYVSQDHTKDSTHSKPYLALLSDELCLSVLWHEVPFPNPAVRHWSCNHCGEYYSLRTLRFQILNHVQHVHRVSKPKDGVDIIYSPKHPTQYDFLPRQYFAPLEPVRCLLCERKGLRLWSERSLIQHIRDSHEVETPEEDRDWKRVRPYAKVMGEAACQTYL